jgi:hypothetical protein
VVHALIVLPEMKKWLILALLLAIGVLLLTQLRTRSNLTPAEIELRYSDQLSRLDYYAKNFTHFTEGRGVEFPPEGAEEIDASLFQIPEILDVSLVHESTNSGIATKGWSNDPLASSSYWFTNANESPPPSLRFGDGKTKNGRSTDIAVYRGALTEKKTGKVLTCRIVFDASRIPKLAEQE